MSEITVAANTQTAVGRRHRSIPSWLKSAKVMAGGSIVGLFIVMAVFGPWLAPYNPSAISEEILSSPSGSHLFGTTALGEDVFSQVLDGARLSLQVGFLAALLSESIAVLVGVTGAFHGGIIDESFTFITNIFLVVPVLPLQILIIAYLGNIGWVLTAVVIAVTHWAHGARKLRAQTLSIRGRDYVEAARVAGESNRRIILFEILPNETAIIATGFIFSMLGGVLVQTSLSFLGLGDISAWSWGTMLRWAESSNALLSGAWWWFVPPGLCLALVGTGLALINLGIDEVVNPRLRNTGRRPPPTDPVRETPTPPGPQGNLGVSSSRADTDPVLTVEGLRVEYQTPQGPAAAVRGVDLELRRREVLGIVGESGSGKSTMAFAITRLLRSPGEVTAGSVTYHDRGNESHHTTDMDVLGASPEQLRAFRWEQTSVVFQAAMNSLNPVLSVGAQLSDGILAHRPGMNSRQLKERIDELLAMVRIDASRVDAYPHQLSGGQRQRVMIAMALALEPSIVIMDEPTTSLDVVVQRDIVACIMDLRSRLDCSFIFITHDLSLLLEVADRVAVMYAGKIIEVATGDQLLNEPRHPYTSRLLGSFPVLKGPRHALTSIAGSPPDIRNIPSGCAFRPRCPRADETCTLMSPDLVGVDAEHGVACHHPVDTVVGSDRPVIQISKR